MNGVSIETVYNTLQASLSQDNSVRSAAEDQLRTWEADSAPGFIGSLLKVAIEFQNVAEVSDQAYSTARGGLGMTVLGVDAHSLL